MSAFSKVIKKAHAVLSEIARRNVAITGYRGTLTTLPLKKEIE
jgi:hypothetical protein